jgi:hypothetical protein
MFPVLMTVGTDIHPSFFVYETCVKKGSEYTGLNVLTISYKPGAGKGCVG